MIDPVPEDQLTIKGSDFAGQTKNLETLDDSSLLGLYELRDKRDSLSNPGFVSYGFGRFGGYRSRYVWKRGRGKNRGQSNANKSGSSKKGNSGSVSQRLGSAGGGKSAGGGLAHWWKAEDKPVRG